MMNQSNLTEDNLTDFAAKLAQAIKASHDGAIIFLNGPLGVGKTTFTRGFLRGLGYSDKVKSPTYTLVEPYEIGELSVFHFDLYRLNDASELEHIGIHEYFTPTSICLVEWPEKGSPLLPNPDLICHLSFQGDEREITIEAPSERGEKIMTLIH